MYSSYILSTMADEDKQTKYGIQLVNIFVYCTWFTLLLISKICFLSHTAFLLK